MVRVPPTGLAVRADVRQACQNSTVPGNWNPPSRA